METNRRSLLLFLLLALLHACAADCPLTDAEFTCYTDYNRIITCVWNSTRASVHTDSVCTVDAKKKNSSPSSKFSHRNCTLEPVDAFEAAVMSCSMDLRKNNALKHREEWSIAVKCSDSDQTLNINFKPVCSIKLNPPEKPAVNFTTVSLTIQSPTDANIKCVESELQWKQEDQSWNDPSVKTVSKPCKVLCETELLPKELVKGQRYEARVRALVCNKDPFKSIWSDWSSTTSWVSPVGKAKAPDAGGDVWVMIIAGATMSFAVFLFVVFVRTNRTTWVVDSLKVSPIPSPEASLLQQNWMRPHFTSDSFHSFLKREEILCVEVSSAVDALVPFTPEAASLEKAKRERSSDSGSSSFSNPSYSHLCSPPPFSSLSAGNLQPCAADSPYGPVVNQGASAEQKREDESRKELEILLLLSTGDKGNESVPVISEYEKVEKVQVERMRLQSLDSFVCSEEVSQESLESDSINGTNSLDEEALDKEEEEEERGNDEEVELKKLFRGSGGIFGKGSIQVCSGYERVQKLQDDSLELPSLDSGVSSGGEEQVSQEDVAKATNSSSFLFAPSSPLLCPTPSSTHLKLPEPCRPDLQTLINHMMEKKALMSESSSMEPPGDGYMPARQEVS
ncbi:interleukin-2 receptor subunit beta-like [Betta splendens]|uniref:Interleukin-2 receptor subunit beta n=1 Tax=Betta splendens TaxID=158456 RepID=A0A6P7N9A2_BETSP|nr:interleukin-2 receptor subunit beta-like [Betta splendens]XP_029014414.1 interleukin-2 receptor subunit beta-like [Betta splendens]